MPPGNSSELLISRTWQPIPGTTDTWIFPEIRKIDVISSNSYLVRTPEYLLLIDPGGIPSQAEMLASAIARCRQKVDLPLVVVLTHAHVDHFTGMQSCPVFTDPGHTVLAAHTTGADAVERADPDLTQGDVLGRAFAPMPVGIRLFCGDPAEGATAARTLRLPQGAEGLLIRDRFFPEPGISIDRESLVFSGTHVEVYHTPGHSPDSICIRIGRTLFIGDLLFASNPGVAGQHGWSQDALINSLECMLAVLRTGSVDIVCSGHGRAIPASAACPMLERVLSDARVLTGIAELTRQRAEDTARFAEDCMEEINELFTILAGRLYYVSHVMGELGETETAAHAGTLIDAGELDGLLESFREFADAHHAQEKQASILLALKAGQVIGKLERSFMKDELSKIIDQSLVTRAERLLTSYSLMLRGFTPPQERESCLLCPVVEAIVIGLTGPSCSDDDILSSTDDTEAFCRMLLARIGTRPLLEDVKVSFERDGDPRVLIDRDLFSDLLTYIIEDLVGSGAARVDLSVTEDANRTVLTITGREMDAAGKTAGPVRGFYIRLCERAGGTLTGEAVPGGQRYTITVGPSG